MHKAKDGRVTASLTEVKNKTGDIFDLVDEYGEVILTSYNKARYKITKIDISEILQTKVADKPQKKKLIAKKAKKEESFIKQNLEKEPPKIVAVEPKSEIIDEKPIKEEISEVIPKEDTPLASKEGKIDTKTLEESENKVSDTDPIAEENKFSNMEVWDRNNEAEKDHVKFITANLL